MIEELIPQAQWAQMSQFTKVSQWLKAQWASMSHVAQWAQTECFPHVIPISRWLKAGQYITRSPVGSEGMLSTCDSDQPVGPSVILGLVGPRRMLSQCKPDQLMAQWASRLHPARWARVG